MKPEEILGGKGRVVNFLVEKGFTANSSYIDAAHPDATFFNLPNHGLLAVEEYRDFDDARNKKNHFLIDQGLTHCALIIEGRVLFYRSYGEIRSFTYSSRTSDYASKVDKLRRLGEDIDILFQLKDVSNDFYEQYKTKRNVLVRSIRNSIDNVQKYLVAQRIFDRIFFIYFICRKGIVRFADGREISGGALFRILRENGSFVENLYEMFDCFNSEDKRSLDVGTFRIETPFLNGGVQARPGGERPSNRAEEYGLAINLRFPRFLPLDHRR